MDGRTNFVVHHKIGTPRNFGTVLIMSFFIGAKPILRTYAILRYRDVTIREYDGVEHITCQITCSPPNRAILWAQLNVSANKWIDGRDELNRL